MMKWLCYLDAFKSIFLIVFLTSVVSGKMDTETKKELYLLSLEGEVRDLGRNATPVPITPADHCFKVVPDFPIIVFSKDFIGLTDFTGNVEHNKKVSSAFSALNKCQFNGSIKLFNEILQRYPNNVYSLIGKSLAIVRKERAEDSLTDASLKILSKALGLKSGCCLGLQSQAEVHVLSGRYEAAMNDINKCLQSRQNGVLHSHAAMIYYKANKLEMAIYHLKSALKYPTGSFPEIHLYLGLCYISVGHLKESIDAFKDALEVQPDNMNALHSVALAFKEIGDDDSTVYHLDQALKDHPAEPKSWMLRGHLHFSIGKVDKALMDYEKCLELQPQHRTCLYMKGLCFASVGRFFDSVKAVTQVMVVNLESSYLPEFHQSVYLREYARYWHAHLDIPLSHFQTDEDIDENFRDSWVKNLPFNLKNYTEQNGIRPQTSDVEPIPFNELSEEAQVLLCKAIKLSPLLSSKVEGQSINERTNRALSLAMLQIAQTATSFWKSPKDVRGWKGRRMSWRDIMNIGAIWVKMVSFGFPVIWIDSLPKKTLTAGFVTQMMFKRGEKRIPRFYSYQSDALQIAKAMIHTVAGKSLGPKARDQLRHSSSCQDIMNIVNKYVSPSKSGFKVTLQIQSSRPKGPMLEGVSMWIKGEKEEDISFSMETKMTPVRVSQYNAELEFVWGRLSDGVSKNKDRSSHFSIAMLYYLCNLIPLSKDSSAVAYAITLGLFLALGKEATTPIPDGKQIDIEALFSRSPDTFARKVLPWLSLKRASFAPDSLPSVTDTFQTPRDIIEILNVDVGENCRMI